MRHLKIHKGQCRCKKNVEHISLKQMLCFVIFIFTSYCISHKQVIGRTWIRWTNNIISLDSWKWKQLVIYSWDNNNPLHYRWYYHWTTCVQIPFDILNIILAYLHTIKEVVFCEIYVHVKAKKWECQCKFEFIPTITFIYANFIAQRYMVWM